MAKYKTLVDPYKCYFCDVKSDPAKKKLSRNCVEIHHIKERHEGGSNEDSNLIPVCSNHHSFIHEGKIKIDRWYFSTCGWKLHWYDDKGTEHWGNT